MAVELASDKRQIGMILASEDFNHLMAALWWRAKAREEGAKRQDDDPEIKAEFEAEAASHWNLRERIAKAWNEGELVIEEP